MNIHKILKYFAIVIGVIGLILLGRILIADGPAIESDPSLQNSLLDPMLWLSYLVLVTVILLVLIFVIKGLFSGNIKNTLIFVGAFLLIVVIGYVITDGVPMEMNDGEIISANVTHWVSAGLVIFYILALIAVGTMVLSGIRKLIKR